MATIAGVTGSQFAIGTQQYENIRYQYATSSHEIENPMNPQLIIQPQNKNDIVLALKYAKSQKIAVAIRTGGHQYSGASSTTAPNIQLDLKRTFRAPDDQRFVEAGGKAYVRTSVSWSLGALNTFLGNHKVFVPHGQCVNVHIGGHVQTGGYGQLGRSFGLFGDRVLSLELIDYDGNFKEVTRTSDPELFYALLGGSPGNLGVITHFTIEVLRDSDYKGSLGLKSLYWYNPQTLKRLVDILRAQLVIQALGPIPRGGRQDEAEHPEIYGEDGIPFWPRTIAVYAQWVPFDEKDAPDMAWFDRIRKDSLFNLPVKEKPMSELTSDWMFRNVREFEHPYVKRTHLTNSSTLGKDGWASWITDRIDAVVKPDDNHCYLSAQLQCYGGKNSKFFTNANNGTSYSWRDSTLVCVLDCFYAQGGKENAEEWQKINDTVGVGPNGKFCKQDRRTLWGSFGSFDLDASWSYYYEDQAKYDRLRKARQAADPDGIFTPNTFSVKR
ncbi:MAG: hypothetical protein M1839_004546 [Geoglossum umbratile]|nr:MAG: hypothetical protein M1839_004546 [Geoglossum umbratile]